MEGVKKIIQSIKKVRKDLGIADAALLVEPIVLDEIQVEILDDLLMSISVQINNDDTSYIDSTFEEE